MEDMGCMPDEDEVLPAEEVEERLEEERELALSRLQRICDAKFISVRDFVDNPLRIFAAHELAAIIDPAMATKMTVQVQSLKLQGTAPG